MPREPKRSTLWSVLERHLPKGWAYEEVESFGPGGRYDMRSIPTGHEQAGAAYFADKTIATKPMNSRDRLALALHECAHVRLGHHPTREDAAEEYEAEHWAWKVMRDNGLSVPKVRIEDAKAYIRQVALRVGRPDLPKKVLRFAGLTRGEIGG